MIIKNSNQGIINVFHKEPKYSRKIRFESKLRFKN